MGQYPRPPQEHIANGEQIVYSASIAWNQRDRRGRAGATLPRLPNPGHKEHGQ